MWRFISNALGCRLPPPRNGSSRQGQSSSGFLNNIASSPTEIEEILECEICRETYNIVENVPCALFCGHTICSSCVLSLRRAVVKYGGLRFHLLKFISCPMCNRLSLRIVYRGRIMSPRKNYYLVWLMERFIMRGEGRARSHSEFCAEEQSDIYAMVSENPHQRPRNPQNTGPSNLSIPWRIVSFLCKFAIYAFWFPSKLHYVMSCLLILLAIPLCAAILALYIPVTLLVGLPCVLILHRIYPFLDSIVAKIFS